MRTLLVICLLFVSVVTIAIILSDPSTSYASLSASPFTNETTPLVTEEEKSDWFKIKAQIKADKDGFDSDDDDIGFSHLTSSSSYHYSSSGVDEYYDYYNVKKFDIILSNNSYLCPTNNCDFDFKQSEDYSGFEVKDDYERGFDGTLKSKDRESDKSQIYEITGFYTVVGIDNNIQQLAGDTYISIGEDYHYGDGINDKQYRTNITITWDDDNNKKRNNADMVIYGKRGTGEND